MAPPFPYGDHHMETEIDTSPYGKGESQFPYREPNDTAPPFPYGDYHTEMWIDTSHYGNGGLSFYPGFHTGKQMERIRTGTVPSPTRF